VEEIAEIKSPVLPDSVLAENNLKAEEPSDLKEIAAKVKDAAAQILFNSGTAYIHPSSYYALDTIVRVLKNDPLWHVDIEGHTDNTGGEKQNLLLSQQRADACKEYLIRAGISENRISAIGYGDLNPIADNSSEEGRKINRRTEFLLFKPGP
jgi:outer membrane protein OmpA-like peptidoglycan-associated protein